jgi:aryl-alcohol dehydrogenase-like predicted oxidoreductase
LEKLIEIAGRYNSTPTRVALAWQLAQPFVTAPIIGANNLDQLGDSMGSPALKLSDQDLAEIEQVSGWERSRTERED